MPLDRIKKQLNQVAEVASEKSKEYGDTVKKRATAVSEKAQEGYEKLRTNHYNPVFPEEYAEPGFDLPKMIVIVDEDERKGIDVCEGAIGWLSKEAGLEVFHLYEEAVCLSGLHFYPRPTCYSIYYVDAFDADRFVSLDCYFEVMQQDKMTELRSIAHSLGAVRCRLETYELTKSVSMKKARLSLKPTIKSPAGTANVDVSANAKVEEMTSTEKKTLFSQTFEGSAAPKRPELRWYAHDAEIKFLIDTRCSKGDSNSTKDYGIEIDCSASSTMSVTLASKIDGALSKIGASCNFSFAGEVMRESRRKLLFDVEF